MSERVGECGPLSPVVFRCAWAACAGPSRVPPGGPVARSGCWRRGWCSPRRRTASASLSLPVMPKPPWYMLAGGHGAGRFLLLRAGDVPVGAGCKAPGALRFVLSRCCGRCSWAVAEAARDHSAGSRFWRRSWPRDRHFPLGTRLSQWIQYFS